MNLDKIEFIVDCTNNSEEERKEVYKWLIETRNYDKSYYMDQNYPVIVCNFEEGFTNWEGLEAAKNNFSNHPIYTFEQFKEKINQKQEILEKRMKETILNVLEKTYENPILRRKTVPLFMSNPGIGKTSTIKEFAENKGVKMLKMTLSQRMPNEVVGMMI